MTVVTLREVIVYTCVCVCVRVSVWSAVCVYMSCTYCCVECLCVRGFGELGCVVCTYVCMYLCARCSSVGGGVAGVSASL